VAEAGVLAPDARAERIEGQRVDTVPIGTRHRNVVNPARTFCWYRHPNAAAVLLSIEVPDTRSRIWCCVS
jgi:hypothetical protein